MNIFSTFLGQSKTKSRDIAKERLQLVLFQDRVNLSQEMMERMKNDIIAVISNYVEIDRSGIAFSFNKTSQQSRLVADIPILPANSRRRTLR
jgi:cell division topological specificity factor